MRLQKNNQTVNSKTSNISYQTIIKAKINKTYSSFNEVLCANINHRAANSLGRVEAKSMVFIPLPGVEYSFGVNCSFIYCPGHSNIYKLTAIKPLHE